MDALRNRTMGDTPWKDPKPKPANGIPDDAYFEGGYAYWIDGEPPEQLHIMCGGAGNVYEIQKDKSWYPDEIYTREQALLQAFRESPQN